MNKVIWKYEIQTTDSQFIFMPIDAEILSVNVQNDKPCIWVLVNPERSCGERGIRIFGTGNPIPIDYSGKYIGQYFQLEDLLVWHVFDEGCK